MRRTRFAHLRFVSVALLLEALVGGCVLGPAALEVSHSKYNAAVRKTGDEQLLLNLVRLQYRDSPVFMDVASVSAQFVIRESAGIGGEILEGAEMTNPDRLFLDADIAFEERPTVTFQPLQGEAFVTNLLSPLSLDSIGLLIRSGWRIDRGLRLTVQSMNGLDNASEASGPTPAKAPEFERFARVCGLFRVLQEQGMLILAYLDRESALTDPIPAAGVTLSEAANALAQGYRVRATEDGDAYVLTGVSKVFVWQIPPAAAQSPVVAELVDLLGLRPGLSSYPIRYGAAGEAMQPAVSGREEIVMTTRSALGILYFLAQAVQVPESHRNKAYVTTTIDRDGLPFDWGRVLGDLFRIDSSRTPPRDAAVRIWYRGFWFYIDQSDLNSKSTFGLLGQLLRLQAGGIESAGPVLTLPVGG